MGVHWECSKNLVSDCYSHRKQEWIYTNSIKLFLILYSSFSNEWRMLFTKILQRFVHFPTIHSICRSLVRPENGQILAYFHTNYKWFFTVLLISGFHCILFLFRRDEKWKSWKICIHLSNFWTQEFLWFLSIYTEYIIILGNFPWWTNTVLKQSWTLERMRPTNEAMENQKKMPTSVIILDTCDNDMGWY